MGSNDLSSRAHLVSELLRRARITSTTIGKTEIRMIAPITIPKLFRTIGRFPKKYPSQMNPKTQSAPPPTLYARNRGYGIAPTPATKGVKVRMIGTNRAMIIVSHDPTYIRAHCDRASALVDGTLHHFDDLNAAFAFYDAAMTRPAEAA